MLGPPVQIAYAVDDVVVAAQRWVARGVGPFFVLEHIEVHHVRVAAARKRSTIRPRRRSGGR